MPLHAHLDHLGGELPELDDGLAPLILADLEAQSVCAPCVGHVLPGPLAGRGDRLCWAAMHRANEVLVFHRTTHSLGRCPTSNSRHLDVTVAHDDVDVFRWVVVGIDMPGADRI